MADAALQRCPLVTAAGAGIGVNVVGRQVKAPEQIGRDIDLHALDVALVAVLIERVALKFLSLVLGHLGEFGLEHSK